MPPSVSLEIRRFRNTDVQELCHLWNAHHEQFGPYCEINSFGLELTSLGKPYFEQSQLLVAVDEQRCIQGMVHLGPIANQDHSDTSFDAVGIFALCVRPGSHEDSIASSLLAACLEFGREQGATSCLFKPMVPDSAFYLGFGPADSLAGVISEDTRTCSWLSAAGFQPHTPSCSWELDLVRFQAPVDRAQIGVRRSSQVNRQVDEPALPWWQACVLGHTEPTAFQLSHRVEKRVVCEVLFWAVAPELQTSPESIMWLWPPELNGEPDGADQLLFLLAESLRQFQSERVDTVRTVTQADETNETSILRRLGFQPNHSGMVFSHPL